MSADRPFFFSLELRGNHGVRSFDSIEVLEHWLSKETEAFQELRAAKLVQNAEPLSGLLSRLQNVSAAYESLVAARGYFERQEQQPYEAAMNQVRKRLNSAYVERGLPPGQSLEVQALRSYAVEDPVAALAALHCLCDPQNEQAVPQLSLSQAALARGLGLATFVRYQLFGQTPDGPATLVVDTTIATLNARGDRTHAAVTQRLAEAEEVNARLKQAWETRDAAFDRLSSTLVQEVNAAITEARAAIDAFRNGHQAEIALKEPVAFWTHKAKTHAKSAVGYGVTALVVAIASGAAALLGLPTLLKPEQSNLVPYYGIAIAVALTTLALWFLRVLVRNYLGQRHLKVDADERVAMVKTYLALMESGKAPADSLGPVLAALFRPASDGLVTEKDSMPLSVAEMLTRGNK